MFCSSPIRHCCPKAQSGSSLHSLSQLPSDLQQLFVRVSSIAHTSQDTHHYTAAILAKDFSFKYWVLLRCRGWRSFGVTHHVRNPHQPTGTTELHNATEKFKACLPFTSLARTGFIWNQNMLWMRIILKTILQDQWHWITKNLRQSPTAPPSEVTHQFELHLVLPTVHYASHEQLWCHISPPFFLLIFHFF